MPSSLTMVISVASFKTNTFLFMRLSPFLIIFLNSNLENLNLDWKLIGTVTGQSPITLPEQFEQLLIKMEHNNVIYSVYALKNWLSSTAKTFRTGYGMSDGNYSAYIGINVSLTQATLEAYKVGNVVNTNSTSVTAYYR